MKRLTLLLVSVVFLFSMRVSGDETCEGPGLLVYGGESVQVLAKDWKSTCPGSVYCIWEDPLHKFEIQIKDTNEGYEYEVMTLWIYTQALQGDREIILFGDFFFKKRGDWLTTEIWLPETRLMDNELEFVFWNSSEEGVEPIVRKIQGNDLIEGNYARLRKIGSVYEVNEKGVGTQN